MNFRQKYLGDRQFYRMVLVLVLPIVIQQGITNFVSLLDNLMVGALGTHPMSGVSIVNQLINVFNLAIFGGISGASIFGTQFYGVGDWHGMRDTFRFKVLFALATSAIAIAIFSLFSEPLLMLFLESDANTAEDISMTLTAATDYIRVILFGLVPFALVQVYAGTLRETGETMIPMIGGVLAIVVNLVFNYLLIYGIWIFPELGVAGAALATVLSRFVELFFVMLFTHRRHTKFRFIEGAYRGIRIPATLVKKIAVTGTPLLINEVLWSLGMTFINSNYASRGIVIIAATNISTTAWNLFCVIMFAMGSAVSILVGQKLGAGDTEGAVDIDRKLLFLTLASHIAIGLFIIAVSPIVPNLYNVEEIVRETATYCLMIQGASLPIHALVHCIYFTVRSGGRTFITFLFDAVYTWVVPATLSLVLCSYTDLPILAIYAIIQFSDALKLAIGIPMVKSGFWTRSVIKDIG